MEKIRKLEKSERILIIKAVVFYLTIGLFLTVALSFVFHELTKQLILSEERNAQKELENEVGTVCTSVDTQLKQANAVCYSLIQNEGFSYMLNNPEGAGRGSAVNKLVRQMNIHTVSNEFIEDILIRFNTGSGINIGTSGRIDSSEGLWDFWGDENTLPEKYFSGEKFTGGKLEYLENGQLCFVQTYPVTQREGGSRCVFIIKFKNQIFNGMDEHNEEEKGRPIITFADLKTYKTEVNENGLLRIDETFFDGRQGYKKSGGYLIAYKVSGQIPAAYLCLKPAKTLDETVGRIIFLSKTFLAISILLCLAFMGAGIWRSYNPIRQLLALMNGEGEKKLHLINFYPEIRSILLETTERKMAYENLYKEKALLERGRFLCTVLENKKSSDEAVLKSARAAGIYPEKGLTCFVCLYFIDITAWFCDENGTDNEELPMRFCEAFLTKLLSKNAYVVSIPYENRVLFCLSTEQGRFESGGEFLRGSLLQVQKLLRERYAIDTLAAVSDYHTGAKGLKAGFWEVNTSIEHLKLIEGKSFYGGEAAVLQNEGYICSVKEELYLENEIKSGDIKKAVETFDYIMNHYYTGENLSPKVCRLRLYSLLGKILDSVSYICMLRGNKTAEEISDFSDLIEFENISEFCNKIHVMLKKLDCWQQSEQKEIEKEFVGKVKEMIIGNYMNPELNVTAIADSMNKNLDFVSRTFKKYTGEGLLDYIQRVRIEKAKQFFRENENLSVWQAANMVGYVSCESFIRVFKSKEGITPGRYKNSIKNGKQDNKK